MLISKRQMRTWSKKLKHTKDTHAFWIGLTMVNALLALVVAFGTISAPVGSYIGENLTWRSIEQAKIDKLAPTETINYFNSVLGEPNVKGLTSSGMTRYIFKERDYWVEAMTYKDDTVLIMSITACGTNGFYPKIDNNPAGKPITLGKSKMVDTTYEPILRGGSTFEGFTTHYYQRGATAPSYYYDEYVGDAVTNYQTVYTGHNELCGYLVLPKDMTETMGIGGNGNKLSNEQVNNLRSNVVVNTFAVAAPSYEVRMGLTADSPNIADGGLGVNYVDAGVLLPSSSKIDSSAAKKKYETAKDFDVIKFEQ